MEISWTLPCRSNGNITKFVVQCNNQGQEKFKYTVDVDDEREEFTWITEDFLPDFSYEIMITAITNEHIGNQITKTFEMKAGCEFSKI